VLSEKNTYTYINYIRSSSTPKGKYEIVNNKLQNNSKDTQNPNISQKRALEIFIRRGFSMLTVQCQYQNRS
jgi:hypothetical protein